MENIQAVFQQLGKMQWSDYLDIILVAFLIYKLLPMIRSTGAARIAKVVVAVLLLSWVTSLLELYTLNFLIDQLIAVGLIAIVVLFQPELRRMLDHLGSMKLQKLFSVQKDEQEMDPVISQTVAACEAMSREHRYLQGEFTELCIWWLEKCAEMYEQGNYDGRNKYACQVGKQITEFLKK